MKLSSRSTLYITVFLLVCIPVGYEIYKPFLAERAYRDGYFFQVTNRMPFAIEELQKAIAYAPLETQYRVQLGSLYETFAASQTTVEQKLFYYQKAVEIYKQLIILDRFSPWYENRLAVTYRAISDLGPQYQAQYFPLVTIHTRNAAVKDSFNPLFQMNYAIHLHQIGQLDEALKYYELTISYDERMIEVYNNMSILYRGRGQNDLALQILLKAADIIIKYPGLAVPEVKKVYVSLAQLYEMQGNFQASAKYLSDAVTLDPNDGVMLRAFAVLSYKAGNYLQAADSFKLLFSRFSSQQDLLPFYANSLRALGRASEADAVLSQFSASAPTPPAPTPQAP